MHRSRGLIVSFIAMLIAWMSSPTYAQFSALHFSGGYSRLFPSGHDGGAFDRNGGYLDADFAWELSGRLPVYAGFGVSTTVTDRSRYRFEPLGTDDYFSGDLESTLGLFSIEGRVALPLFFPRSERGFFIEPKLGAGLLIDDYATDIVRPGGYGRYVRTLDHSGAAFDIRPSLEAGYAWGRAAAGVEVSYMAAWGDFGILGSQMQELRAGVFFRLRF
jgi:hypothetical protein